MSSNRLGENYKGEKERWGKEEEQEQEEEEKRCSVVRGPRSGSASAGLVVQRKV